MGWLTPKCPKSDTPDIAPDRRARRLPDMRILICLAAVPSAVVAVTSVNAATDLNLPEWVGVPAGLIVFAACVRVLHATLTTVLANRLTRH